VADKPPPLETNENQQIDELPTTMPNVEIFILRRDGYEAPKSNWTFPPPELERF
jgi:hypothetical protein